MLLLEALWTSLSELSEPLNVLINAAMLCVWALYFQLLLNAQKRQHRPKILINRSAGKGIDANCIISNMSAEPIYVEAIVLKIGGGNDRKIISLTNLEDSVRQPEDDARAHWFQGPINQGEYVNLGAYRSLLERAAKPGNFRLRQDRQVNFEVSVIANYGPDDLLVGAVREFRWQDRAKEVELAAGRTRQIRARHERRQLACLAEDNDF